MTPKHVQQLAEKKYRNESGLFIVEGEKNIKELLASSIAITELWGTKPFLALLQDQIQAYTERTTVRVVQHEVREEELVKMGTLQTNHAGIAVARQKKIESINSVFDAASARTVLVLDDVRDPGNVGTIMRTADWYGVTHIVCSPTTTDQYNPKVIAASMGSYTRMHLVYTDLTAVLTEAAARNLPVIAADLTGENTHTAALPKNVFLIMGSESHGVSNLSLTHTTNRVMIPRFGNAESLNVSVATGILLDTITRSI
jgi:RNA methyltransferase, TrmH family